MSNILVWLVNAYAQWASQKVMQGAGTVVPSEAFTKLCQN